MRHVLFWLSYVLFFGLVYGKYENNYSWYFLESSCMLPFIMFATYMAIYVCLPYYFKTRNAIATIIFLFVTLFLATLGERVCLRLLNSLPLVFDELFSVVFIYLFLETNVMVGSAIAIKLLKIRIDQQKHKHKVEKETLQSELNVLKAQLHPHFLFNTMNNLYAISLEESSGKTSEGIAKISGLLRSVLYECNELEYSLEKELKLIDDFIELEMMRYAGSLDVSFEKKGSPSGLKIAPMLLFTLVENCFKHGRNNNRNDSWIKLCIVSENKVIKFEAYNSKGHRVGERKRNEGIGLINLRKRLEILYKGRYELIITEDKNTYKANLQIRCK